MQLTKAAIIVDSKLVIIRTGLSYWQE